MKSFLSASPTASNAALLADVTVFKFSEGKTTSFQTGNAFNINEQKGESTSINNGTRNTLSDSSNAQFIDQRGITNERSSSDSISDQDASTHTASNGTANKVTQDRDNVVRDLGLAMAGGDAFEEALQKPSLILRPESFYLLHRPNFCANDCSGYF